MPSDREDMKHYMQFRTQPRRLPTVLSIEQVSEIVVAAPGPGLKYRAALSISYGAGLRATEVCNLKVSDIDSDRVLIHVDEGKNGSFASVCSFDRLSKLYAKVREVSEGRSDGMQLCRVLEPRSRTHSIKMNVHRP